ncbi:MAG: glycerol-3-phosphate 1-O-acyltransferase PlsY [bacterium]
MQVAYIAGVLILSYILGSIPFAYIVCRLVKGVDVRDYGSGNVGATNVSRVAGFKWFVVVLLLDGLKGATAAGLIGGSYGRLFSETLVNPSLISALAGVAAVVAHTFTFFLKFKGGKGVATGLGAFAALAPIPMAATLVLGVGAIAITRYVSLGSVLGSLGFIIFSWGLEFFGIHTPLPVKILGTLAAVFVIYKHQGNIKRLISGTERKFGEKVEI